MHGAMNVFISWSDQKAQAVALALREWLPGVINSVNAFVSTEDIYAGTRWQSEIASQLDQSNFGIVCVTGENQTRPWLNFEAGALAKAVKISRVIPLAIDLKTTDVQLPLGQFQAQPATKEGLRAVLVSLNEALGEERLSDKLLQQSLDVWWPELAAKLEEIAQTSNFVPPVRSERELLEETLNTVRSLATAQWATPQPAYAYSHREGFFDPEMDQHAAYIRSYPARNEAEDAVREIKRLSPLALAIFARVAGREAEGRPTWTGSPRSSPVPTVAEELARNGLFAFVEWDASGRLTSKGRATARVLPIGKADHPKPEWWNEVIADLCLPASP
jgi:hypothetical protein